MIDQDSIKNLFTGGMNLDIDKQLLSDGDYVRALNIRNQINGVNKGNVVTNVKGNTLVPFTQPAGINKAIGAFKDASDGSIIFMVYNSNGDHQIRRYNADNTIDMLAESRLFAWDPTKYITNINLVDDLLYWTDTECRKLNIKKSFNGNKKLCWDVVLASGVSTFTVIFNNGIIFSKPYIYPASSYQNIVDDLNQEFQNRSIDLQAKVCAGAMEICQTSDNNGFLVELVASEGVAIPRNFYPSIIRETFFAGKAPQNCMPRIELKLNRDVTYDYITDQVFQFRTRMVYDDYEKSVLSPISDINVPECNENYNYIEVDFTEARLLDSTQLGLIRGVEVFVRVTNEGVWKLIKFIPVTELWKDSDRINATVLNFYNDSITNAIDNATANRQFDAVPISPTDEDYSICQEFADNRIIYANFTENYERPCIDASLDVAFIPNQNPRTFNISFITRIYNASTQTGISRRGMIHQLDAQTSPYPVFGGLNYGAVRLDIGNNYDQYIPLGGFLIYLAGQPFFCITKQIDIPQLAQSQNGVVDTSNTSAYTDAAQFYVDNPTQDVFSVGTIKNVPAGKYVVRVASHKCSFGDVLGCGSLYDVSNGNGYQQTSTYVRRFLGSFGGGVTNPILGPNTLGEHEISIEIDSNGNWSVSSFLGQNTLTGTASPDGDIYVGEIEIQDLPPLLGSFMTPTIVSPANIISGYAIDAEGLTNLDDLSKGVFTELLEVSAVNRRATTDHNGFFYFLPINDATAGIDIRSLISASYSLSSTSVLYYNNNLTNDIKYTSATGQALGSLYNGTLNASVQSCLGTHIEIIVPCTNPSIRRDYSTTIEGIVLDTNANPVQNISIVYEDNGRQEVTDRDGRFSVLVFPDGRFTVSGNNATQRIYDNIILSKPLNCSYTFSASGVNWQTVPIQIVGIGTIYDSNNPYIIPALNPVVVTKNTILARKYLKNGGKYRFACRHVDGINRRHALYTENDWDIYLPFTTEDVNQYYPSIPSQQADGSFAITLTITSEPPIEAEYFYIYRTQDAIYGDYLQFPVSDVKYVQYYDSDTSTIIETTFAARNAKEIYLSFEQTLLNYQDFNSGSNKSWIYSEGDRIRFIRTDKGALFPEFVDLPILASRDGFYVIEALDALGEILPGALVEVYTPKTRTDDDIEERMFEIPICVKVLDPGTPNRRYERTVIPIETGDTYRRTRIVPIPGLGTVVSEIEDNSISDFFDSRDEDIGRFDILDDTFDRLIRTNAYRFSNRYEAGTKLNGLSSFEGANVIEIGRNFGAVKSIKLTNDGNEREVVLSIFENRCVSIYVGAAIFNDLAETDIVALSSQVLGAYRALKGDFGTVNPESVWLEDGNVRWWDGLRGKFCQYGINGLVATSNYGIRSYAASLGNQKVISIYDEYYSEWIATVLSEIPETIAFNDEINKWVSFYSFTPELYCSSGRFIVSFKDGECWVHDTNPIRNNFYGTQYVSQILAISKVDPISTKMFLRARVQGSLWYMPEIDILPNDSYPFGMRSRLLKNNWSLKEGEYWANFLRDINDPKYQSNIQLAIFEGRKLRGQVLQTLLENDQTDEATIRMLEVYSVTSERGNP